jgi:hypothetical protein
MEMADQPLDIENLCRSTQDLSIWEALKAKNFKTAIQNVDKRIRKDTKSNAYLVVSLPYLPLIPKDMARDIL